MTRDYESLAQERDDLAAALAAINDRLERCDVLGPGYAVTAAIVDAQRMARLALAEVDHA